MGILSIYLEEHTFLIVLTFWMELNVLFGNTENYFSVTEKSKRLLLALLFYGKTLLKAFTYVSKLVAILIII